MKNILGQISHKFKGFSQQDSHEAFILLLEYVHEDINKIVTKEYQEMKDIQNEPAENCAERWYKMSKNRDDSIVTEIFEGQ